MMDRFLCKKWWKITPHKNGDWVSYEDAMGEIAELKAIIKKLDPETYRGLVIEEELENR